MAIRPKRFKAGFFMWSIKWSIDKVDDAFGKTDMNRKVITIYGQDNQEIDRETLMHELLHVALEDKIDTVFDGDKKNDEKEESLVRLLSPTLIQILSDNKKLTKYLFET